MSTPNNTTNNIDQSETKRFFKGIGFVLGIVVGLAVSVIAFAILSNIFTAQSEKADLNSTPTHTTEVSLTVNEDDVQIAPGESRTITGKLKNGSQTDSCYVFVELEYNSDAWSIQEPDGWVKVEDGIYAYGSENMTPLESEHELQFQFTATVIAEGTVYQNMRKENFKISMTGMAINSSVSRAKVGESYQDYENGGNAAMISVIEGS